MDKHKLLWIIFSAAFLVLVVVLGLILFLPSAKPEETAAAVPAGTVTDFDAIEWVRTTQEPPALEEAAEPAAEQEFVVVVGETDSQVPAVSRPIGGEPARTTATRETPRVQPRETAPQPAAQQAPAKPATRTVRGTEYWIQAGSYTSQTRAEQVKEKLQAKGIKSRIVSKDVQGQNYFRVRIGPYENREEAEKFLAWIKEMQDFEGSYISQVYVEKTIQN
jgi:cell division protein FtsN